MLANAEIILHFQKHVISAIPVAKPPNPRGTAPAAPAALFFPSVHGEQGVIKVYTLRVVLIREKY